VKRYLEGLGFAVKGEVCGCDLVALRGDEPPMGTVTLIGNLQANDHGRNGSRCDCRLAPGQHSLIAKHAQGSAGGQMALDVEHIVDGGVD
jgi:hypothetical protein